jgi:thioredoxin 1
MRKPTLLLIIALAGFSALQVILQVSGGDKTSPWSENIHPLTNGQFDAVIQQPPSWVAVHVWAPWCTVCKRTRPQINLLSEAFGSKLAFYHLDADQETEWADTYRVGSLPTTLLFYQGQEMARFTGYSPAEALQNWITHTTGIPPESPIEP